MLTEEEFNRLNSLTEEEFAVENDNLSGEDFFDFVERQGTMTWDEMDKWAFNKISEIWGAKR